jgi:hypothetical protein
MATSWFPVDQPDTRFRAEGRRMFGPFYRARVLDTATGEYLPLFRGGAPLTGRSSVRRAVTYGIELYRRRHP